MAKFHAGQRVKRVEEFFPTNRPWSGFVGRTGTITGFSGNGIDVQYDNGPHHFGCEEAFFVPLTDPKADEFIERIKKLKPYEEPAAPKFAPAKFAPTATFNGMTLVCTEEGVWALRNGVWTKVEPI